MRLRKNFVFTTVSVLTYTVVSVYLIMPIVKLMYLFRDYMYNKVNSCPDVYQILTIYKRPAKVYSMLFCRRYLFTWFIIYFLLSFMCLMLFLSAKFTRRVQTGINYKKNDGTHGSAVWMTLKEAGKVLEIGTGNGILFGTVRSGITNKMVTLPMQTRKYNPKIYLNSNVAVFGASGSMKSRAFIRNSILQDIKIGRSMIITDPKGELYQDMAELLRNRGYIVRMFNINNRTIKYSDRWNPISEVEDDISAQTFSEVTIANTKAAGSKAGDPFWDRGEQNLLKALVLYVVNEYPEKNRNLSSVYSLIASGDSEIIDSKFDKLDLSHPAKIPYNIYRQAPENVRSGIIIGLGARLQVFQNKLIQGLTSENDIDLSLPGKERCAYFCISSDMESTFDFLGGLFYSFLFIRLINYADMNGGRCEVDVDFKLDEFPNIGQIPDFPKKISTMRSRGISAEIIFQNIAQLENRYPNKAWSEILGNCDSTLCLGTTDIVTAEYVSKIMGDATVETIDNSIKNGRESIFDMGTTKISSTKRELLSASEMLKLERHKAILLLRGQNPLMLEKMDYTKHPMAGEIKSVRIIDEGVKAWAQKLFEKEALKDVEQTVMTENSDEEKNIYGITCEEIGCNAQEKVDKSEDNWW
ncbi:VirD4-like conjugal transfer protein, CD1115 family [Clostridium oryzae]|uniref:Type IV secretory system conjugative DNA transfer n=1 Tax=Clostridium oryzae TaxID=1450648 RepID=A0A1V4IIN7_9CLOT|nr:type IV secretory system conjugative DNA transfer family protein [Clostridium oryzae]OPJ59779.1 type IV secretory system conjugative DNA transfer [Clostridium oryzae]